MFWAVAKEITGFFGALLIAIPWLRDFGRRVGLWRNKSVQAEGSLKGVRDEIVARDEDWLARAKTFDLVVTLAGLSLIAGSFAIGLSLLL